MESSCPNFTKIGPSSWKAMRSLAPRGLVPADTIPWGMAVSPDGRYLAVTGFNSATLMVYAIAADGSLTRAATLPWDERITDVIVR